ncbi:ATPase SWSAP1 isoform X2 [Ascaphus truei]|uniref:ATPase SWSAP1 isoform X2 n=1 Tax=Ascaphus truei TaxID=8439 RepID=UPI003F59F97A
MAEALLRVFRELGGPQQARGFPGLSPQQHLPIPGGPQEPQQVICVPQEPHHQTCGSQEPLSSCCDPQEPLSISCGSQMPHHQTCGPQELLSVSPKCRGPQEPDHAPLTFCGPQEPSLGFLASCGPQGPPLLLLGPAGSGKSSLLFLTAVLAAEEGAGPVIFLSQDPLKRLPGGGRATRDPLTLKQIRFLYPPSLGQLLRILSSLHLSSSPPPSLILVDGVERYLSPGSCPNDGALLSALLLDSAAHFRCGLLASATPPSDGADVAFSAVERYFPTRCHLYPDGASGEVEGAYRVSFLPHHPQWTLHTEHDGTVRICPVGKEGVERDA